MINNSYITNDDILDYIKHSVKLVYLHNRIKKFLSKNTNHNHFKVDHYFYKYINDTNLTTKDELLANISEYGFENGLIYHPQQLQNLFPGITFTTKDNLIIAKYNDIEEDVKIFVKNNLYQKDFDYYLNNFIKKYECTLQNSELILLIFIGDYNNGIYLLQKVIAYKKKQDFALGICFRSIDLYNKIKPIIQSNFTNYSFYVTNEFGNDIIPTLIMYTDIITKISFSKIIKLQTKSDRKWLDIMLDYLLSNNLCQLNNLLQQDSNCNCLGHSKYKININDKKFLEDVANCKLKKKYAHLCDKEFFIGGTIFFCDKIVFDKVIDFIKNNNYRGYFTNNLYDINIINLTNSLVHYVERLFGIIRIN